MQNGWINKDFRAVDKRNDLGKALGWFRGETKTLPVVMDGKKVYGIVDGRQILGRGTRRTTKIDKVARSVPYIPESSEADAVIDALDSAYVSYAPVCSDDGRRCVGIVEATSMLAELDGRLDAGAAGAFAPQLLPEATINDAVRAFTKYDLGQLPIVEGNGYIAGIIQRSDLVRLAEKDAPRIGREDLAGQQTDLRSQPIEGIMEGGWTEIRADAGHEAITAIIEQQGYTLLTSGGTYAGLLDGLRLIHAIKAETKEEALYGTATPHYRRHSSA